MNADPCLGRSPDGQQLGDESLPAIARTTSRNTREEEASEDWPRLDDERDAPDSDDFSDIDDAHWDAFLADDDELDPLPDRDDFWIDPYFGPQVD